MHDHSSFRLSILRFETSFTLNIIMTGLSNCSFTHDYNKLQSCHEI